MALDYLRECVIHENLLLLIIFLCNDVVLKKLAISSLYVPKHVAQYLSTYFASVVRMQTCDESVRDQLRTHCSTVPINYHRFINKTVKFSSPYTGRQQPLNPLRGHVLKT